MKKLLTLLAILGVFLAGCEDDTQTSAPVEVSVKEIYNPLLHANMKKLNVVSIVDEVEITNVVLNRGNCKINPRVDEIIIKSKTNPNKLKYGQSKQYWFIKEVQISTDRGTWTFSFN